jgi:DNA-binding response OmpR family regulator
MDQARKEVKLDNKVIDLTRKEYQILKILIDNRDRFVPREIILESVWSDTYVSERTVDVHVARLRKRLGEFGSNIRSKSGYGYHIVENKE